MGFNLERALACRYSGYDPFHTTQKIFNGLVLLLLEAAFTACGPTKHTRRARLTTCLCRAHFRGLYYIHSHNYDVASVAFQSAFKGR